MTPTGQALRWRLVMPHWFYTYFVHVLSGKGYQFWSGIGSDIGEIALIGALIAFWGKHNSHVPPLLAPKLAPEQEVRRSRCLPPPPRRFGGSPPEREMMGSDDPFYPRPPYVDTTGACHSFGRARTRAQMARVWRPRREPTSRKPGARRAGSETLRAGTPPGSPTAAVRRQLSPARRIRGRHHRPELRWRGTWLSAMTS